MLDSINRQPEAFFLEYDGSFCPWYAEGMENQTTYAKFLATLNNFTSKFSSQQKAADELGVPQPTISKIKSGKGVGVPPSGGFFLGKFILISVKMLDRLF